MADVLIVEDIAETAEAIQAVLEALGLTVVVARHGQDAIDLFAQEQPRLIILDLELPNGVSGWQVLETIQDQRRIQEPAIIVTTVYADVANRLLARLQGVHSYLVKPFSLEQIEHAVCEALGLSLD